MKNMQQEEAGWEFTLPGYVTSPITWIFFILLGIALFLLFVLINKLTTGSNASAIISPYIIPGGGKMS